MNILDEKVLKVLGEVDPLLPVIIKTLKVLHYENLSYASIVKACISNHPIDLIKLHNPGKSDESAKRHFQIYLRRTIDGKLDYDPGSIKIGEKPVKESKNG
jgi:hypothetical protein